MAENNKHVYDESKIKTLSSLEHIRLRTGMYIGRIGDGSHYDDGCYVLLKEVIDNAIDEFIMGYGKVIEGTLGFRCERARILGLWFSPSARDAELLAGIYGVPAYACLSDLVDAHQVPAGQPPIGIDGRLILSDWGCQQAVVACERKMEYCW